MNFPDNGNARLRSARIHTFLTAATAIESDIVHEFEQAFAEAQAERDDPFALARELQKRGVLLSGILGMAISDDELHARIAASRAKLEQSTNDAQPPAATPSAPAQTPPAQQQAKRLRMNRDDIIARHPIVEFVRSRGHKLIKSGENFATSACPVGAHEKRGHTPNTIYPATQSWHCHDHDVGGTVIDWLKIEKNTSAIDAMRELAGGKNDSEPRAQRVVSHAKVLAVKSTPKPFDWQARVDAVTDKQLEHLAEWRAYSREFCAWLKESALVGIVDGCIAFPVHVDGKIVGAHVRAKTGKWYHEPSGINAAPMIFGALGAGELVHFFESQWDAFAFMAVSGERSGIVCTRGAGNGKFAVVIPERCDVYAWKQNDELKDGKRAGDDWLKSVCDHAHKSCTIKLPAVPAHDLNDWTRDGATSDELFNAVLNAQTVRASDRYAIRGQSMVHYSREQIDRSQNLLGNHWLERERGVLVTGPSGIGKSTAVYQMTACWACGVVSFGIAPLVGGLRIVAVQTEDSHSDLIEMSRSVRRLVLTETQLELVERNAHIETINDAVGKSFIDKLDSLLEQKPCDLLVLNPISDFIPGELTDEAEVKKFLRQQLNPLLAKHRCGALCVQPTPKTNRDSTENYSWFDWMYWGAGSAEFARWARGGIVIVPTATRGTYRFIAAKRFDKLGWVTPEFWYAHSLEDDVVLWVPATEQQIAVCTKAKDLKPQNLHAVLPSEKELLRDEIRVLAKQRLRLGTNTTDGFLAILVRHEWVTRHEYPRPKARAEVRFLKTDNPSKPIE